VIATAMVSVPITAAITIIIADGTIIYTNVDALIIATISIRAIVAVIVLKAARRGHFVHGLAAVVVSVVLPALYTTKPSRI
jgi:hypothetical protein